MTKIRKIIKLSLALIFLGFVFPKPSYAYLDPGAGSYLFQIIVAGVLGVSFAAKMYWSRIKGFVSSLFRKKSEFSTNEEKKNSTS